MDTIERRRRGRPLGSGYNDFPRLRKILELKLRSPGLSTKGAIQRLNPSENDATILRLQRKLKPYSGFVDFWIFQLKVDKPRFHSFNSDFSGPRLPLMWTDALAFALERVDR